MSEEKPKDEPEKKTEALDFLREVIKKKVGILFEMDKVDLKSLIDKDPKKTNLNKSKRRRGIIK